MLTAKKVEVMAKNHHNKESMANLLKLSIEDLENELHRLYASERSYDDISRRLKSNDKMAKKLYIKRTSDSDTIETSINTETIDAETTEVESTESVETSVSLIPPSNLDEVLAAIEEKKAEKTTLERRHKSSVANRNNIKSRIQAKKEELLKLKEKVKQIQDFILASLIDFEAEEAKMKEFNSQIAVCDKELDALETQKEKLSTLSIWVYTSGQIIINNEEFKGIPENWFDVYTNFFGNEALDSLTGFEQKLLAKVFSLIKVLPKGSNFEICFESNDMTAAYEILKNSV